MIVEMTKYNFMIYHRELDTFLEELMELGVVHVLPVGTVTDEEAENLTTAIREGEQVVKKFEKRKVQLTPEKPPENWDAFPILSESAQLELEYEDLESKILKYRKEVRQLEPWGEIPHDRIDRLREAGIMTHFFHYPENKFDEEWASDWALEVINRTNNSVYFVIFHPEKHADFPVAYTPLPTEPLATIRARLAECEARQAEINTTLNKYASTYLPYLKEHIVMARDRLHYCMVNRNVQVMDSHKLVVVEGWCPVTREAELQDHLDRNKTAYMTVADNGEEKAPVLLKNNPFARLFEPIGEMFSLPAYTELDLTAFFAPFFLLFFGFCLGDAGYGLVILLAATIARGRIRKKYKPVAILLQLFGISTIVLGFVSGTLFGLELVKVQAFESMRRIFLSQDQLFNAALVIGLVQILFGMGVQVYKKVIFEGWLNGLNKLGWIIMLLSLIDIVMLKMLGMVSMVTVFLGTALIVFFGSPKSGAVKSFGLGLADLYNITGVMGDLLSYIRLFALGVSSAILGLVVNSIALSAKGIPYVGIGIMILILILGHTGNLLLASLSAFVHPMRLTFVEFYKNVGFEGGGKPYEPFERKIKTYREEKT
jgi:V/A-type H+-transporting ATPase subunit I